MTTTAKPSFIKRFFLWLFSWKTARRFLIAVAIVITLWALFHAEENWRGQRAWKDYKATLEASGQHLDLQYYFPKPVSEEQNFAATAFCKSLFDKSRSQRDWSPKFSKADDLVYSKNLSKGERHFTDLAAWQQAFTAIQNGEDKKSDLRFETDLLDSASRAKAAPFVLAELKEFESDLADLKAASLRPYSHYPINYNLDDPVGILLPHLARIKALVRRLQFKACAELASGDSESAFEDIRLAFYITDSIKDEPFLISLLVRFADIQLILQPIWEGLAEHRWSESQLKEFETRLQQFNLLNDLQTSLDEERAGAIQAIDLFKRRKYRLSMLSDIGSPPPDRKMEEAIISLLIPRGWFDHEKISLCRLYDVLTRNSANLQGKLIYPQQIIANTNRLELELRDRSPLGTVLQHRTFAIVFLPALDKSFIRCAHTVVALDEAATACALERYRLHHNQFPERLEDLSPMFVSPLPHDVLTGKPFLYRKTDDGQFTLYSIGWNQKDDSGIPGKVLWDNDNGDWVWKYPSKTEMMAR